MMSFENTISTKEALLGLLDTLLEERGSSWWTEFYIKPDKKCPFFTTNPNEDLVKMVQTGFVKPPMRVLEIGCGNGRNANYLAGLGFIVDGVDFSSSSLAIAEENAKKLNSSAKFFCQSIFEFEYLKNSYDLIYDCGCLHHIPPHRRPDFLALINNALKPEGVFGLVCFAPGGGSDYSDIEVYEKRSMGGGLSFTEASINELFSERYYEIAVRRMKELSEDCGLFGKEFLWAIKMKKK